MHHRSDAEDEDAMMAMMMMMTMMKMTSTTMIMKYDTGSYRYTQIHILYSMYLTQPQYSINQAGTSWGESSA